MAADCPVAGTFRSPVTPHTIARVGARRPPQPVTTDFVIYDTLVSITSNDVDNGVAGDDADMEARHSA